MCRRDSCACGQQHKPRERPLRAQETGNGDDTGASQIPPVHDAVTPMTSDFLDREVAGEAAYNRDVKRKAVGEQMSAERSSDEPEEAEKCGSRRAERKRRKAYADLERRRALMRRERAKGAPRSYQLLPNACEACRATGSRCEMLHSLSDSVCARCHGRQLGCVFPQQVPSPERGEATQTPPEQSLPTPPGTLNAPEQQEEVRSFCGDESGEREGVGAEDEAVENAGPVQRLVIRTARAIGGVEMPRAASQADRPASRPTAATPAPASASAWPGPSYPQPQRLAAPMPHVSPHGWVSFGSYSNPLFGGTDPGTPLNLVNGVEVSEEPTDRPSPRQQPD